MEEKKPNKEKVPNIGRTTDIEDKVGLTKIPDKALLKVARQEIGAMEAYVEELEDTIKKQKVELRETKAKLESALAKLDRRRLNEKGEIEVPAGRILLVGDGESYAEIFDKEVWKSVLRDARKDELVAAHRKKIADFRSKYKEFAARCGALFNKCYNLLPAEEEVLNREDRLDLSTSLERNTMVDLMIDALVPDLPMDWLTDKSVVSAHDLYRSIIGRKALNERESVQGTGHSPA